MAVDAKKSSGSAISHLQSGGLPGPRPIERRLADMMDRRADAVVATTLRSSGPSPAGARIILTELGVRVEISDPQQHTQVMHYLDQLCERFGQLPRPGATERILIMLSYGARLSIVSKLPLTLRRYALYWLAIARERVGRRLLVHHQRQQALTVLLSVILDEPSGEVRGLLRQHQFWLEYHYARRLVHLGRDRNSERLLATFQWPEREAYLALAQNTQQARVLVTIHMGDFFGVSNTLRRTRIPPEP